MKKNYKPLLYLSLIVVIFSLLIFFTDRKNGNSLVAVTTPASAYTIVIDPGHGGIDGGTTAVDGTLEKEINLSIAKKLRDTLEILGIKTVMTREIDTSIHDAGVEGIRQQKISDIRNRSKLIEETENAVYISIHQNHFSQSKYKGAQVFYSPNNDLSKQFATIIQEDFSLALQPQNKRGVKKSGTEIYLLFHAKCPAVMVECGFLSNYEDTELLKSDKYQNKLSILIANSIIKFITNSSEVI